MTTAAHTTPRALTAYLRRATWGLPEARRQELWDELEEHVLTRADHLILTGLTPTQATAQAIHELGPPARVTLGMAKVYTMPKLILATTTLALGISAGLYALAGSGATSTTLTVVRQAPVKPSCARGTKPSGDNITIVSEKGGVTCYTFNDNGVNKGVFLKGTDVTRALDAQGITLSRDGRSLTLGGTSVNARFTRHGAAFFEASSVVNLLVQARSVRFSGYTSPRMQVGNATLLLNAGPEDIGAAFYNSSNSVFLSALTGQPIWGSYFVEEKTGPEHLISTGLRAGEAVMLVTSRGGTHFMVDTGKVDTQGRLSVHSQDRQLRFVSSLDQLGPYLSGGRRSALLVRITNLPLNDLRSGVFVPAQATSDAR
ncbi:permease prefix domain 1-containing protein [Deinococcus depolymerans]|uniref:Permease prefix domain 1-containing protein n=1 Tax=Deinococcus depolymerans TaxID=392408 RepID=A0ABP3LGH2_9DEIO